MNFVIFIQAGLTVLGAILLRVYYAPHQADCFAIGSGMMILSFFLLGIGYGLIFKKKMIALAIAIIVFKYAILGIIIFALTKLPWFDPLWFCMGVASFVVSAIAYALKQASREGKDNVGI